MLDVSVIIVNWNTRDVLRDCLKSVYEQTKNIQFEVIVIDNASSDGSAKMVMAEFPSVILIENSVNRGFAAANNEGIAMAKGRYILLLNSDTIVCDDAIEETIRYADNHPEAAVVGCQVWENASTIQMTCFRFPSAANLFLSGSGLATAFRHNRILGREQMLWWKRDSEKEVDVVPGMFMLARRTAINEVGLLDEEYFVYGEDADWCYRFKKAGWKVLFLPGAKMIHVHGGSYSSNQAPVKMFVQKQKSLLIFIRKHRGLFQYWWVCLILSLAFCFRVFIWGLLMAFRRITGNKADRESALMRKHWAALKFCSFRLEPTKDR